MAPSHDLFETPVVQMPGHSGGPVVTCDGEVVAWVSSLRLEPVTDRLADVLADLLV